MTIISIVLDQHAEEAALLWLRRDWAVGQPNYDLDDLAKLDGQLDAQLDGLRIAEADTPHAAWAVCERELNWGEEGEIFPAAILAAESVEANRFTRVLEAASASYEHSRALVSALAWLQHDVIDQLVHDWLGSAHDFHRQIAMATCAVQRKDVGPMLEAAFQDEDPRWRARALRAAGELGRLDLVPQLCERVESPDEPATAAAAWSATLLAQERNALRCLQVLVERDLPDAHRALQLVLRCLDPTPAMAWIKQLDTVFGVSRAAVIGAGLLGDPRLVPWLIDQMEIPQLARVAGEAFGMITGVDLAYHDLEGEWPAGFEAGPTEDAEDENVQLDPDENLPWPNRRALADWWIKHRDQFIAGNRHLVGRPIDESWCLNVLRTGSQRQRAAAAIEIALRHPGQPLFEVRSPGYRQKRLLRG